MKGLKRKGFIRLAAVILTAVMLNSYIVSAAEAEEEQEILTVDTAVSLAIKNSTELKNLSENKALAEDDADDANTDLFYATEYTDVTSLSVQLKNLRNNITTYNANEEITKEKIELSVIQYFAAIMKAQDDLMLYDKQLEITDKEMEIAKVKLGLGLLSQNDYDTQLLSYKTLKNDRNNLEISISDAFMSLNKLLGSKDLNKTYELELDIDYAPFDSSRSLSTTITKELSTNQSIKEKENSAEVAKYELDVYSALYSSEKKESKETKYAQAVRSLSDAKTELTQQITDVYNNIIKTEAEYNANIDSLEQKKKDLTVNQLQLSLGKITELDLLNAEYEINKLEAAIQNQIYSHDVLVRQFNNSNLI